MLKRAWNVTSTLIYLHSAGVLAASVTLTSIFAPVNEFLRHNSYC